MSLPTGDHEQLVFKLLSTHDDELINQGRLGFLTVPRRPHGGIETPNFLAITSRGTLNHVTPDVLQEHLDIPGIHLALEDFIERTALGFTPPILRNHVSAPIHSFTTIPDEILTVLSARRTPAVSSPLGNSHNKIKIFTSTGFSDLKSEDYASYIQKLNPDIAISLADIPTSGKANSTKRLDKMTDRTVKWLKDLISSRQKTSAIFAPILPLAAGTQGDYFDYLADGLSGDFHGLAFYDADLVLDIPPTTTLNKLPRLSLDEPSSPQQILRQISLGIDLMITPFVIFASESGIALDFHFPPYPPSEDPGSSVLLPLGTNLWSSPSPSQPSHAINTLSLSSECFCYTCRKHSTAYIHHLLNAKEMLAWTLLQIHNHHLVQTFFSSIRSSIAKGRFEDDCRLFERRYEAGLPEKTGLGPRIRGYHFRNEGPGEGRRNEKSWGGLYLMGQGTAK